MKRTEKLTMEWWSAQEKGREIPEDHQEHLREEGREQAEAGIRNGQTCGELNCGIDDATGATYRGWWDFDVTEGEWP